MESDNFSKGVILVLATALISGVSVFVNGVAVKMSDAVIYTTLKNIGSLIFLLAAVFILKEFAQIRSVQANKWPLLILIGILGGSIPFALFFTGLKMGGAVVSSFIYRSLFIFAGVFGYFILKEKPERKDFAAAVLILIGNAMLLSGELSFGVPQLLVLAATLLWALEYTISRKVLAEVPPKIVMISRMFFGSIVLLAFTLFNGTYSEFFKISAETMGWLILTSLLLFGFLLTWYNGLKYLPVFKAASLLAIGGMITATLEVVFTGKVIGIAGWIGLILAALGAFVSVGIEQLLTSLQNAKNLLSMVE